jgi:hypothetical protein
MRDFRDFTRDFGDFMRHFRDFIRHFRDDMERRARRRSHDRSGVLLSSGSRRPSRSTPILRRASSGLSPL